MTVATEQRNINGPVLEFGQNLQEAIVAGVESD